MRETIASSAGGSAAPRAGAGGRAHVLGEVARLPSEGALDAVAEGRVVSVEEAQIAAAVAGVGVTLVPALTAAHHGLVPVPVSASLRPATADWPEDELFLVTHRALREVPRVRVVWELLVERVGERARRS